MSAARDLLFSRLITATALVAIAALVGCNSVPVSGLEKSFTLVVDQEAGTGDPVKIDFLWVMDNSASMCDEQVALAENFKSFTGQLTEQFELDARLAVVTMDMLCPPDNPEIKASNGEFSRIPATNFPPSCQRRVRKICTTDDDCANLDCQQFGNCDEPGEWICEQKSPLPMCMTHPNGSINTECKRRCASDEECQAVFQDERYFCQQPSGNQADWGCVLPPQTSECPTEMPAYLDSTNLDLFPCAATVGVNQLKCYAYEQGLASAYGALNPTGPNKEQSKDFLRDDAYLVIVFVSDEDDCSADNEIGEDYHDQCALLDIVDKGAGSPKGGPLVDVSTFVNRFKSLKADPSRVIVAAIAGDAVPPSPEEYESEIAPKCFTCSRTQSGCDVYWDTGSKDFRHACEALTCEGGFCGGDEALGSCTSDANCANECQTPTGEVVSHADFNGQDPRCTCVDNPRDFDASDYTEASGTDEIGTRALFAQQLQLCQRTQYIDSKANPFDCHNTTYVCEAKAGIADYGTRYWELTERFGSNGIFTNICDDEGFQPALDAIGGIIIRIVNKVCLPKPVSDTDTLVITKTVVDPVTGQPVMDASGNPQIVTLERAAEAGELLTGQFKVIAGGEDCRIDGDDRPAITFGDNPVTGEQIFISYQADPQLGL